MAVIREVADRYVDRLAVLDPVAATRRGVLGHEHELTDYSPDGVAARHELAVRTLADAGGAEPEDDGERIARDVLRERLQVELDRDEAGEWLRDLRNLHCPVQEVRQAFDLMATHTDDDWDTVATRMERVPGALAGVVTRYRLGLERRVVAPRRQVETVEAQSRTWSGEDGARGYFDAMVDGYEARTGAGAALVTRLRRAAAGAQSAYAAMARFLRDEYLPHAGDRDAVGPERYRLGVRTSLGTDIDLEATYAWGWDELARIEAEMERVAREVDPTRSLDQVLQLLATDPARAIEGVDRFRAWLQQTMDEAVVALHPRHFDIAEPLRRVEAMIAPPGGAAAMYYTPPSDDFSRPGRTWYPARGLTRFPLWQEVSTAYHEGVPGHHLQVGQLKVLGDRLNRFQRTFCFVSGHGEGWALYAERLMEELGLLTRPEYVLGMLAAHAFRATRVIVDIGMHLELTIPDGQPFHPGERWTPALALAFAVRHSGKDEEFMTSEITRYLGWPGQAISYKVGEREWLDIRARASARPGFDLRAWHARALDLGPMGLAQLRRELLDGDGAGTAR